ncbi:MAG TPA: MBL fold metallo-hydrolase [Terriglobia bacterium]|nr:MBL fold metallo-hydrolase [Terriglobia bacterium]
MKTLKTILAIGVVLSGAVWIDAEQRGGQFQSGAPPKLTKVLDDIYLIENSGQTVAEIGSYGGNITVALTDEGVLLVDSKNERIHDDVLAKIKSLTNQPVKYVVLTHNHQDHAGGAAKFAAEGAQIIISTADRENMARSRNPGWMPSLTYEGKATLFLGGKKAQLLEYRGHTRGDTVVFFPGARVLVMGDLLTTADTIPLIVNYDDGGSWAEWTRSVDSLLGMDWDTAIPGHGPMVTKAQVRAIRAKMVAIQDRVRSMNRERKSSEEISRQLLTEFGWGSGPASGNIAGMIQEFQ